MACSVKHEIDFANDAGIHIVFSYEHCFQEP